MKKFIATAMLPLLLALGACGTAESDPNESQGPGSTYEFTDSQGNEYHMEGGYPDDAKEFEIPGDNFIVYTVTLKDGTECYVTGYRGGIWCRPDTTSEVPSEFE